MEPLFHIETSMKTHTISMIDLCAATGWGRKRINTLLNKEPALTPNKKFGAKGGNAKVFYNIQDLLPRLSEHKRFTHQAAIALIRIDQEKRLQ